MKVSLLAQWVIAALTAVLITLLRGCKTVARQDIDCTMARLKQ